MARWPRDPHPRLRGRRSGRARTRSPSRRTPPAADHHDHVPTRSEHNIDDAQDPPEHDLTAADRVTVHDILEHLYATIGNYDDEHHVDALDDSPGDLRAALYRLRDLVGEAVTIVDRGGPG